MINRTKISLFSGAALLAFAIATPASAAPVGSYQQTCRNIEERSGQVLTAECQARDGSWSETRLDRAGCTTDIANINGRLVCSDNGQQADRRDHSKADGVTGDNNYGDQNRRDNNGHQADRRDYSQQPSGDRYANDHQNVEPTGDRNGGYDNRRTSDEVMSRRQMVSRMERQGYHRAHDLRQIRNDNDWRALASWHGRRVVVRLNAHTGRVISARYI